MTTMIMHCFLKKRRFIDYLWFEILASSNKLMKAISSTRSWFENFEVDLAMLLLSL